jgi:hypothetical protein
VDLYEALRELGKKKSTNCLPIILSPKDYHHSLVHGKWSYLEEAELDGSGDVYALLSLPDKKRQPQISKASVQAQSEGENLKAPLLVPSLDQHMDQHNQQYSNQPDRPAQ